eukprot:COSAG02_NODE_97_length_37159_cov_37.660335_25_plen_185_part_00
MCWHAAMACTVLCSIVQAQGGGLAGVLSARGRRGASLPRACFCLLASGVLRPPPCVRSAIPRREATTINNLLYATTTCGCACMFMRLHARTSRPAAARLQPTCTIKRRRVLKSPSLQWWSSKSGWQQQQWWRDSGSSNGAAAEKIFSHPSLRLKQMYGTCAAHQQMHPTAGYQHSGGQTWTWAW